MRDHDDVQEWITKAEEDFAGALDLHRRRKHPLPNLVCYHAQQCVEKYLKAFLISREVLFPKVHDLLALLELCLPCDTTFEQLREPCLLLDPYSVLVRYPGQDAAPEEAASALKAARKLKTFIHSRLPI